MNEQDIIFGVALLVGLDAILLFISITVFLITGE